MSLVDLTEKKVIITGSSRGIGYAIAECFAQQGGSVVISSRRQDACETAALKINSDSGRNAAFPIAADISSKTDLNALIDEGVKALGGLDCLICNAASSPYYGPLIKTPDEAFKTVLQNNILSSHWLIQRAAPHLEDSSSGSIIVIASIGAFRTYENIGAYSVSKAAVLQLVRSYAQELGQQNIRINSICPGVIETDFSKSTISKPAIRKGLEEATCLGRLGVPEDIAPMAAFLASSQSSYTTGQHFVIDGGASL